MTKTSEQSLNINRAAVKLIRFGPGFASAIELHLPSRLSTRERTPPSLSTKKVLYVVGTYLSFLTSPIRDAHSVWTRWLSVF